LSCDHGADLHVHDDSFPRRPAARFRRQGRFQLVGPEPGNAPRWLRAGLVRRHSRCALCALTSGNARGYEQSVSTGLWVFTRPHRIYHAHGSTKGVEYAIAPWQSGSNRDNAAPATRVRRPSVTSTVWQVISAMNPGGWIPKEADQNGAAPPRRDGSEFIAGNTRARARARRLVARAALPHRAVLAVLPPRALDTAKSRSL